ncbi:small heat shock protein [Flammula alnicola]|nr:small heat shock protein [Flammula alnicola]
MPTSSSNYDYEPFLDFDRFFEDSLSSRMGRVSVAHNDNATENDRPTHDAALSAFKPRMDLHENQEENLVTVRLELPGVKKEDVNIEVHNERLTVTAENKLLDGLEESGYATREIRYGKFLRTLHLPLGVEAADIKASMENGVLSLTFPKHKTGQVQDPQRIQIL